MQTRYYCPACQRQFAKVESVLQPFEGLCPACGSPHIAAVTFFPGIPGMDYDPNVPDAPRVPTPEAPPPQNFTILLTSLDV